LAGYVNDADEYAPSFRAMGKTTRCVGYEDGGGRRDGDRGGSAGTAFRVKGAMAARLQSARPLRGVGIGVYTGTRIQHVRRPPAALMDAHLMNQAARSGTGRGGTSVAKEVLAPGAGAGNGGWAGDGVLTLREKLREAPSAAPKGEWGGYAGPGVHHTQSLGAGASGLGALRRNAGDVGASDGPYSDVQFVVPQFHSKKGFNFNGAGWL
jgi:hypothetical protein